MVLCPKCNTVNSENEKYCKNCGFQLNASRICPQCGKTNYHNSKYCDECGATLSPVNNFKKNLIAEESESSFFNKYRTAIIAALILVLAIGAVTGITLYGGNGSSGAGEPSFPLIAGNSSQTDDNTDLTDNGTDADDNSTLDNKTRDARNLTDNSTQTNKNSPVENKTNKVSPADNKANNVRSADNKTNNTGSADNKTSNGGLDNKANNSNQPKSVQKTAQVKANQSQANNTDKQIEMDNKTANTNKNQDKSSSFEIKMTDVPNLAKEVADRNYKFQNLDYKGNSYSESQCLYIFCKYVLKVNGNDDSPISVKSISKAPNPDADDLSQEISKSDYLSMAKRIVSFIDNNGAAPNYVGIAGAGSKDLSPDKLLYLYTQIVLNYGVTGDLPQSVEI